MVSQLQAAPQRVVAFLDLGTNSIRLSVVRINANHSVTVLTQQKEAIRLGDGEFAAEQLQPAAMDRAVLVCRKFHELARSFGVEEFMAVATSATREAHNQGEFLHRLQQEAGVDMRVISGSEEARLIYRGVASGIYLERNTALFLDIGGGSTEIIVGDQKDYQFLDSLKLGAIRLTNLLVSDKAAPVTARQYQRMQEYVRNTAIRALQRLRQFRLAYVVGSSGTAENLANMISHQFNKRPMELNELFSHLQLKEVIRQLCALPLEERRRITGLNPERADIIICGAAILDTLMEDLEVREFRVSFRGLRDGMLVEYLTRNEYARMIEELSLRERSVLQLGRICAFDEPHARNVSRLAVELFDSARAAGLHLLGSWERELLGHAALLHDLGAFLSYHNHQSHTYYFIRNADLLGFDQTEIGIMAATAYFHRKTFPRKKYHEFASLDERSQQIVRVLCIILRLAESLDRSHGGIIDSARFAVADEGHIVLTLCATQDCHLELWGLENHREAFFKAFGKRLTIGPAQIEF